MIKKKYDEAMKKLDNIINVDLYNDCSCFEQAYYDDIVDIVINHWSTMRRKLGLESNKE